MPKFSTCSEKGSFLFVCPGCWQTHQVWTAESGPRRPRWSFNGDIDSPTISPSLRVRYYSSEQEKDVVCHSFIKDGKIQYLNDCTHELTSQTVEIPDWNEYWKD